MTKPEIEPEATTDQPSKPAVSSFRLRLGVFFLILFWIPIWAAIPALIHIFGITSEEAKRQFTIAVLLLQGAFGLLSLLIIGKQVMTVVHSVPKKRVLPTLWRMFLHGNATV